MIGQRNQEAFYRSDHGWEGKNLVELDFSLRGGEFYSTLFVLTTLPKDMFDQRVKNPSNSKGWFDDVGDIFICLQVSFVESQ